MSQPQQQFPQVDIAGDPRIGIYLIWIHVVSIKITERVIADAILLDRLGVKKVEELTSTDLEK
jgi:hypothetical protein